MRFVAKIASLPVRRHIEEWDERAQASKIVQQGILAVFEQGLITEYELERAYKELGPFKGLPQYEDQVTQVEPRKQIRVYDTDQRAESEHWDAKTKQFVENFLLNHELYGKELIAIETPRRPAPWPTYDKLVPDRKTDILSIAARIVAKVIEDEYEPVDVLAYERENLNRPEIVAALEPLLPATAPFDVDELVLDA